ncbi:MAG: hypothetical protein SOW59_09085 [Corynebacterium sp.]|nr:hypothetical protein [Corynebacterium sp.]
MEFVIEEVPAHLVLARRAVVEVANLGDFFGPVYDHLVEICDAAGVEITGCRAYYFSGGESGSIDVAAAFTVPEEAADALRAVLDHIEQSDEETALIQDAQDLPGLLSLNHYPAKSAAVIDHAGAYDELGSVWNEFAQSLAAEEITVEETSFEDYIAMGDEAGMEPYTKLYWFIAK